MGPLPKPFHSSFCVYYPIYTKMPPKEKGIEACHEYLLDLINQNESFSLKYSDNNFDEKLHFRILRSLRGYSSDLKTGMELKYASLKKRSSRHLEWNRMKFWDIPHDRPEDGRSLVFDRQGRTFPVIKLLVHYENYARASDSEDRARKGKITFNPMNVENLDLFLSSNLFSFNQKQMRMLIRGI